MSDARILRRALARLARTVEIATARTDVARLRDHAARFPRSDCRQGFSTARQRLDMIDAARAARRILGAPSPDEQAS